MPNLRDAKKLQVYKMCSPALVLSAVRVRGLCWGASKTVSAHVVAKHQAPSKTASRGGGLTSQSGPKLLRLFRTLRTHGIRTAQGGEPAAPSSVRRSRASGRFENPDSFTIALQSAPQRKVHGPYSALRGRKKLRRGRSYSSKR